jgi:hypothetical protein
MGKTSVVLVREPQNSFDKTPFVSKTLREPSLAIQKKKKRDSSSLVGSHLSASSLACIVWETPPYISCWKDGPVDQPRTWQPCKQHGNEASSPDSTI